MDSLNDCLLANFQHLGLKNLSRLEQVNEKFDEMADFLIRSDLYIFDRMPPFVSKFKFTGELWRMEDAVYVTDLNRFLVQHAQAIQNVKRLVIVSVNQGVHDFAIDCGQLEHLELYSINFKTPKILESSSKLQNVYLHEAFFNRPCKKLNVSSLRNASISIPLFAEIGKNLKSIQYLEINDPNCHRTRVILPATNLSVVERLKLPECQFGFLKLICDRFPAIKRVDYFVEPRMPGSDPFTDQAFRSFLHQKKTRNQIRPFGINSLEAPFLSEFYGRFHPLIHFDHIGVTLIICKEFLQFIGRFVDHLNDFFKLTTVVSIINLPYTKAVYKRLVNVNELIITMQERTMKNFKEILSSLPDVITCFKFYQDADLIDVPDYFFDLRRLTQLKSVHKLKVAVWQRIDLSFLLEMPNLKYLILILRQPIEDGLLYDLLEQLKYLVYLQILFVKPDSSHSKEELGKFVYYNHCSTMFSKSNRTIYW